MNYIIEKININDKEYDIFIGKNAKGNDEIIKKSHKDSLWFHFNNISSAHIILDNKGDIIPKRYINQIAAKLFDYKKSISKNTNVIYTEIKHIQLTNILGTVIPKHTKIIKF